MWSAANESPKNKRRSQGQKSSAQMCGRRQSATKRAASSRNYLKAEDDGSNRCPWFGCPVDPLWNFGIQKFRKPRIIEHVLEIAVGAGLQAVARIQFNRTCQVRQAFLRPPGDAVEH